MNKGKRLCFAVVMVLSLAFMGDVASSSGPFAALAQTRTTATTHKSTTHHRRNSNIGGLKQNHHNLRRIGAGTADGSLTRMESNVALREERRLKRNRKEAKADGVVTPSEKSRLRHESRNVSKSIHSLRHNDLGNMGPGKGHGQTGFGSGFFNKKPHHPTRKAVRRH